MFRRVCLRFASAPNPAKAIAGLSVTPKCTNYDYALFEKSHAARNYEPMYVVWKTARGISVTDVEGKTYMDFLSGYGTVSQGHTNPFIADALIQQLKKVTLPSRAFYNAELGKFAKFITTYFGYDRVLPMNTGAEAVETAFKIARRWGYERKGIPRDKAIIVCCAENFHGRTMLAASLSDDPPSYKNYGPFLPGIIRVPHGDINALGAVLKKHGPRVAGFLVEPVQGEAGVKLPPPGYLRAVARLCKKHNVLFIADEVQCGIGRTGALLATQHDNVRADMVILAKALGGGIFPVSAVLADAPVMGVITPGTHGSTFGGNPMACSVAIASLQYIHQKKLVANAKARGAQLLRGLQQLQRKYPEHVKEVRGLGLMAAIEFRKQEYRPRQASRFVEALQERGVLAKITHEHTVRLSPPLTITQREVNVALARMQKAFDTLLLP